MTTSIPRTVEELGLTLTDLKDKTGKWKVGSLFYEYRLKGVVPYWTVKDQDITVDGVVYPSLKKTYLDCEDPTDYTFAMEVFNSWQLWERVRKSRLLQERMINSWRDELNVRLMSKGVLGVIKEVGRGKGSLGASKYLIEEGWLPNKEKPNGYGRPSKKRIRQEAQKLIRVHQDVDSDLDRIETILND